MKLSTVLKAVSVLVMTSFLAGCYVAPVGPGAAWVPGHYGPYGHWHPGHYVY